MKTFEQIEAAANNLQRRSIKKKTLGVQTSVKDMADIWEVLTPVLEFLAAFWLIPKKWRRVIKIILEVKASHDSNFIGNESFA